MQKQIQLALKSQFGASIDMLTNVINKCPENYYIKKIGNIFSIQFLQFYHFF